MKLIKRGYFGWSSTSADHAKPNKGLVLHYDGPGRNLSKKKHSECVKYWKETRSFHMNKRGWSDIGYSYGVCPHAYVFEGRGALRQQAAQPGGNSSYYSCTLMLGESEYPTEIQVEGVKELRLYLHTKYGNSEVIKPHKEFVSTSCPGPIISAMIKEGVFSQKVFNVVGMGDTGSGVKKIQKRINVLGYKPKLDEDGFFGTLTDKAVRWFQKKNKLKVDGLVGKETYAKLFP